MLARRPDLRAAERQLAAANAQIGVAEAGRFPRVSLLGLIGIGGTSAGDLFDSSQLIGAAVPRLSWNLFDFGRNRASVQGAEAGRDAARADYDVSVLAALQDAETSLARFGAARTAFGQAADTARHAATIARLQDQRAEAGTIARGEALEAQRQAIDAQLGEVDKRAGATLAFRRAGQVARAWLGSAQTEMTSPFIRSGKAPRLLAYPLTSLGYHGHRRYFSRLQGRHDGFQKRIRRGLSGDHPGQAFRRGSGILPDGRRAVLEVCASEQAAGVQGDFTVVEKLAKPLGVTSGRLIE